MLKLTAPAIKPDIIELYGSSLFLIYLNRHYIDFNSRVYNPMNNPNLKFVLYIVKFFYLFTSVSKISFRIYYDLNIFLILSNNKSTLIPNLARKAFMNA